MGEPFLNPLLDKQFSLRKEKIVSNIHEAYIFKGADCKVMSLKFAGSS